jgi:nickel-dependent lactate racemase
LVEVWLPYGKTEVCVRVPTKNLLDVIEPNDKLGVENPQAEIKNALTNPFGTKSFTETVKPGDKVSVVLKDSGASTNQTMVSTILEELNSTGIRDGDITVIIAYDPLCVSSRQEETPLLSEDLSAGINVVQHDYETSDHAHVGKTSRGTEVYLNKRFIEADAKIVVGVVEPHPCAGYSGGREGVLPGVSSFETIQHNLSLSLDKKAERGSLEGNPVHEDMVEAASLAEVDFALDIVRNRRLEVVKAFAGDIGAAFDEAVKLVDDMYKVSIESRADMVFASPGGYPFDADLFEACKSLDAALKVTKRGKAIVLAAECVDGYGTREFYEAMSRFKDSRGLEKSLKRRFSVGGFMAYRLKASLQSAKIVLVSTIPDHYVSEAFGMQSARTVNEAFRYASDVVGKNGKVSFIPYGNLTMPCVKAAE